jgi:spore coat polysaccharide biosynthesis predicted glycosyltransferase SpsG
MSLVVHCKGMAEFVRKSSFFLVFFDKRQNLYFSNNKKLLSLRKIKTDNYEKVPDIFVFDAYFWNFESTTYDN